MAMASMESTCLLNFLPQSFQFASQPFRFTSKLFLKHIAIEIPPHRRSIIYSHIASCLHSEPVFPRRSFLVTLASVFVRPLDRHASADEFVDPLEQAIVDTLNARDSLPLLCEYITRFKSNAVENFDLQTPGRTLGCIYESLETSLPKLAEQFELEEDTVLELLGNLAYAQDAFHRSCLTRGPINGLENCLRLLKLASVQVDELLEQLPAETIESAQLIRGVRPTA